MDQFKLFQKNKISRDAAMAGDAKSDFFHTNTYASTQNTGIGAASGAQSFETRQSIEKQRKMVQGYNNSKVFSDIYTQKRLSQMTPRTQGGAGALFDARGEQVNGGNQRSMYGRTEGGVADGSHRQMYGRTEGGVGDGSHRTSYGRQAGERDATREIYGRRGGKVVADTETAAKDFSGVASRAGRITGTGSSASTGSAGMGARVASSFKPSFAPPSSRPRPISTPHR